MVTGNRPNRPQLSDEAASFIRALIMSGELRPGSSVRPETIAEALNISTTPAREALQALRVEGFLELLPRRGFQVAPLTGQDIRDLFQVQALIAGELAARAAVNATNTEISELEALHASLVTAAKDNDVELLEERNHNFHRRINLLAKSRKIIWALELITRYVPRQFYPSIRGWSQSTLQDHGKVLDAIRMKDPEASRAAIQEHVAHAGELLANHFDERVAANDADDDERRSEVFSSGPYPADLSSGSVGASRAIRNSPTSAGIPK